MFIPGTAFLGFLHLLLASSKPPSAPESRLHLREAFDAFGDCLDPAVGHINATYCLLGRARTAAELDRTGSYFYFVVFVAHVQIGPLFPCFFAPLTRPS